MKIAVKVYAGGLKAYDDWFVKAISILKWDVA